MTQVNSDEFSKWFPGLNRTRTECNAPRLRLLCFHSAGCAEDIFTNEGIGNRKFSTLLNFCRETHVEMLAAQMPGRMGRRTESLIETAQLAAAKLFPVVFHKLSTHSIPYVIIAHSAGCWIAYEFLKILREEGIQMPLKCFFSCFPAPNFPVEERPWVLSRNLSVPDFQNELRRWNVNEILFSQDMWDIWEPMMRADFKLFDEYEFMPGVELFEFPIVCFFAIDDQMITRDMVASWKNITTGHIDIIPINGNHLFVLGVGNQRSSKLAWLDHLVRQLN